MRKLALESLTLTNTRPDELIRAAAAAGFDLVSLWVQAPSLYPAQLLLPAMEAECAQLLADTGIEVVSLECFDLHSEQAIESYRPALELGARLGGKVALAINYTNPDPVHTADLLARFAEAARECGLGANLEPVDGGKALGWHRRAPSSGRRAPMWGFALIPIILSGRATALRTLPQ